MSRADETSVRERRTRFRQEWGALVGALRGWPEARILGEAQRAATAALPGLARAAGRPVGFTYDGLRVLDRVLSDNFYFSRLQAVEVYEAGFYTAEVLRRNLGGGYAWLVARHSVGLKIGRLYALPLDQVLRALERREADRVETYAFQVARKATRASGRTPKGD